MTRSRVALGLAVVDMLAFIVAVLVHPAPDYVAFTLTVDRSVAPSSLAVWVRGGEA